MMVADICVFACTGHVGNAAAHCLLEETAATGPVTLLLAGRNVDKVLDLKTNLLTTRNKNSTVNIVAYEKAVDINDDDAVRTLVAQARVVVNCIDFDSHPRALIGVAEACAKAGVHYLDVATRCDQLQEVFHLDDIHNNIEAIAVKSKLVPSAGFDFAFVDLAVWEAERAFMERYPISKLDQVQVTLALRTGPLGIKWPLRTVKRHMECPKSKSKRHSVGSFAPVKSSPPQRLNRTLAYIQPLQSWSIRWPFGGSAVTFLLGRRHWTPDQVDARLALPKTLWKAVLLVLYGLMTAAIFLPLLEFARYMKVAAWQKILLWILPKVTFGFFTDDDVLYQQASEEMKIEVVVTLRNNRRQSLVYHVVGPSAEILNPLCITLSALELAKAPTHSGNDGILTPAIAMGDTDFWPNLKKACDLKIEITEIQG